MPDPIKPIRRVVTGNDANGRSRVLFDSAAPNVNPGAVSKGTCMTDVWVYKSSPAPISGERVLVLDSGEIVMTPGDVVVQLGNWHGWTNPRQGSLMAFVMMGGKFEE